MSANIKPTISANTSREQPSQSSIGGLNGAILNAADAAKAQMKKLGSAIASTDSSWRNTLSSAAMGVAGAATAVGVSALAFYAYHKLGADTALIVEPGSIQGIGEYGAPHIKAAVSGLGQVDTFMSGLTSDTNKALTMGDFFAQIQRSGVDPAVFKSAVAHHADLLGGHSTSDWAERLTNPATPLTASVQARVSEVVWYHDKQVAINGESANDAFVFVKAGFAMAAASATSSVATGMSRMKDFMEHMKSSARRTAVDCGLIDEMADRQVRKTIKVTAFDPMEARARVASEYAERQMPMHRFYTQHWLEASIAGDRPAMLQLFGMEKRSIGKHTCIGQATMIDHFCVKELHALARDEPEHGQTLSDLAERRGRLEDNGIRAKEPVNACGDRFPDLPIRSISEMVDDNAHSQRGRSRAISSF